MGNALLAQSVGNGSGDGLQVKTLKNVSSASVNTIYQHQWYGYMSASPGPASLITSTETSWIAMYPLVWFTVAYIDYTISGSVSGSTQFSVLMLRPGNSASPVGYSETLSLPSTSSGRLTPSRGIWTMMDVYQSSQSFGPLITLNLPTGGTSYTATLVGKVQALTLGS